MTLIEVLVASVLLGVGVVGLVSVASLAMRNQQRTEQRASALYLAQEKLAEVELIGPHVWMLGHPMRGAQERDGVTYDWTIQIDQLAVGELFSAAVEARWAGPGGGGAVELETWLNDYAAVAPLPEEQGEQAVPGAPRFSPPR
jgi:type II secretory pathway pseudopilin PulG